MSYYPIQLDKVRNLKYGMVAIDLIEKKFKKPVIEIEQLSSGKLTMEEYATIIHAGLVHEDKSLTPKKVMELIDEYSSIAKVAKEFWKAFNAALTGDEETEEVTEEKTNKGW